MALKNRERIKDFTLCGTGNTSRRVSEVTGLKVQGFLSGLLGGDQQIGALVAEGENGGNAQRYIRQKFLINLRVAVYISIILIYNILTS